MFHALFQSVHRAAVVFCCVVIYLVILDSVGKLNQTSKVGQRFFSTLSIRNEQRKKKMIPTDNKTHTEKLNHLQNVLNSMGGNKLCYPILKTEKNI